MTNNEFMKKCKDELVRYFNEHNDATNDFKLTDDKVFCVWYCKTLQNSKGLFSTSVPDGLYYEFTYNGDKRELYMDVYKKWENVCIKIEV